MTAMTFSVPVDSPRRLGLLCALLAMLVFIGVPVLHEHQESDVGSECAACLVQHAKATIGTAPATITFAYQIALPEFQFSEHFAAPCREFWIDTLSRGPPTV